MKTNLLRTSIVAVLAATAAFAQNSTRLQANVPFDFIVGNQALPAGQYTVDRGPADGIVMIRSADGKNASMVLAPGSFLGRGTPRGQPGVPSLRVHLLPF